MGLKLLSNFLLVSFFSICLTGTLTAELVPVYLWETTKNNEGIPALGHLCADTFKDIIYQKLSTEDIGVVVFVEHNLSPEDFLSQGREKFKNILELSKEHRTSYMPMVENPVDTIKDFAKDVVEISIKDLSEIPESKNLIINFDDADDLEDRTDMLIRHDVLVANIYKKILEKQKQVIAVVTGRHSSWIVPEEIKKQRSVRSVSETSENITGKFLNTENFLLYIDDGLVFYEVFDAEGKEVESENFTIGDISTSDKTSITLSTSSTSKRTIKLNYNMLNGYWYINNIEYGNKWKSGNKTLIQVPMRFSYNCYLNEFKTETKEETNRLTFPRWQLQFYGNETQVNSTTNFNDAYNCVGFTTVPIWSGLFVTFILAVIMTLGLAMMMDIRTMDRFDDPKGKTIVINVSE